MKPLPFKETVMARPLTHTPPARETLSKMVLKGLTDQEMAFELGLPKAVVARHRRSYGLSCNLKSLSVSDEPMTGAQQSLFFGSLLGDAGLTPTNRACTRASLVETHAVDQRNYVTWKHRIWGVRANPLREYRARKDTHQDTIGFTVKSCAAFGFWFPRFYGHASPSRDGKWRKIFPPEIVSYITPLALAVWYQDDGSACHWPTISCRESNHPVGMQVLQAFGFDPTLVLGSGRRDGSPGFELRGRVQAQRFLDLVRPHIHPELGYKLNPGFLSGLDWGDAEVVIDASQLEQKVSEGFRLTDLMRHFKVGKKTLYNRLGQLGLEPRTGPRRASEDTVENDLSHLVQRIPTGYRPRFDVAKNVLQDLVNSNQTASRMACRLGLSRGVVARLLAQYHLTVQDGAKAGSAGWGYDHITKESLHMALESGMSSKAMALAFECTAATVRKRIREYGLDLPSVREARLRREAFGINK